MGRIWLWGATLVLVATAPAVTAAPDAALSGAVTDATGLPLPGVFVEARSAAGAVRTAVTDRGGAYAIAALPPDNYEVTFRLPGFRLAVRGGVEVVAGATVTLDVELALQFDEQVVVVGSRTRPRSVTESQVPIDAIPIRDIQSQGATALDYQLRTLIPSFNVATHPISDATTLVRPAALRNLAHDQTLILVNGERRHRSSVLAWFGGVTDGSQGPDISSIPAIALRQVEVLRDGASAQYGSDAIAGVINLLLKDSAAGGSIEVRTGTYRAGDGDGYTVAGNVGLPLGAGGFANLSLEYGNADPTDRSVQRADAHRRRQHGGRGPGSEVGQSDDRGRSQAVRQLRPSALLLADGITAAETLTLFRFFINDFSTRTAGIDVVSTWTPPSRSGDTVVSFTMNYTDTKMTEESDLLAPGDVLALERGVPRTRWNAAVNQRVGRVSLLGPLSYYGDWVDLFDARFVSGVDAAILNGRPIFDLEASVPLAGGVTLTIGGQNVFDTFSDRNDVLADALGVPFSQFTPWGFSGGYYYARTNVRWGR